jgi:hypothetical protein
VYVLLRPFALIVNKSWEGWEGWEGWSTHLARCSDALSSLGPGLANGAKSGVFAKAQPTLRQCKITEDENKD